MPAARSNGVDPSMRQLRTFIGRHGVMCFSTAAVLLCAAATVVLYARHPPDLLESANKLGPSAQSLVEGRGLAICYGGGNCFHAQRMPFAPLLLAGLYLLFGEHGVPAALVKALLLLLPVVLAFALVWRGAHVGGERARWAVLALFLVALLLPPTLDAAANLNFEEAYFYSPLLLAVTLLLFPESWRARPRRAAALFWLALLLLYLTKSSVLLLCTFLLVMAAVCFVRSRQTGIAAGLVLGFLCVPLGWGIYQRHVSGRFTTGTSLDGVNLYKGNNPLVLEHYPAFRGASLDSDEAALFEGRVSDADEWAANDFGLRSAERYMRTHPGDVLRADLRKASVFFLGVQRNGGDETYSPLVETAFTAGLLVFRVMLLSAIVLAARRSLHRSSERFSALVFLGTVFFAAVPYLVGFALTRHAVVLALPAAAYLCRVVCDGRGRLRPAALDAPGA